MSNNLKQLQQQREQLITRIATQRDQISEFSEKCEKPAAILDKLWQGALYLKQRPALLAGALTLCIIKRKGLLGTAKFAWKSWKKYRQLRQLMEKPAVQLAMVRLGIKR